MIAQQSLYYALLDLVIGLCAIGAAQKICGNQSGTR